jgi:hypothetical protein
MKLANLIVAATLSVFAGQALVVQAAEPAKKTAPAKKEEKKHKKLEGTKVPDKAPAKKANK